LKGPVSTAGRCSLSAAGITLIAAVALTGRRKI
jgi:hypothetical protein